MIAWGAAITLVNNTIAYNQCNSDTSGGAGVYAGVTAEIQGCNNIFYGNEAVTFPDVSGSEILEYTCSSQPLTGVGSIADDPLFTDAVNGDFSLQTGSPCIDAGDPASPLDPDNTICDMGALYFHQYLGIVEDPAYGALDEFTLISAYPNPFNPVTTLRYQLPKASRVQLTVYSLTGARITELVDGWRNADSHEVSFDGSGLASGVYIFQLSAGEFSSIGKMVLMK